MQLCTPKQPATQSLRTSPRATGVAPAPPSRASALLRSPRAGCPTSFSGSSGRSEGMESRPNPYARLHFRHALGLPPGRLPQKNAACSTFRLPLSCLFLHGSCGVRGEEEERHDRLPCRFPCRLGRLRKTRGRRLRSSLRCSPATKATSLAQLGSAQPSPAQPSPASTSRFRSADISSRVPPTAYASSRTRVLRGSSGEKRLLLSGAPRRSPPTGHYATVL